MKKIEEEKTVLPTPLRPVGKAVSLSFSQNKTQRILGRAHWASKTKSWVIGHRFTPIPGAFRGIPGLKTAISLSHRDIFFEFSRIS